MDLEGSGVTCSAWGKAQAAPGSTASRSLAPAILWAQQGQVGTRRELIYPRTVPTCPRGKGLTWAGGEAGSGSPSRA